MNKSCVKLQIFTGIIPTNPENFIHINQVWPKLQPKSWFEAISEFTQVWINFIIDSHWLPGNSIFIERWNCPQLNFQSINRSLKNQYFTYINQFILFPNYLLCLIFSLITKKTALKLFKKQTPSTPTKKQTEKNHFKPLKSNYRISANSFLGNYSFLKFFDQRSQYISIKFPLHKPSKNLKMCY